MDEDQEGGSHQGAHAGAREWLTRFGRQLGAALLIALFAIVGGLTLLAAQSRTNANAQISQKSFADAPLDTPTPFMTPTPLLMPTATALPAPTATPAPTLVPLSAVVISYPCASVLLNTGNPGVDTLHLCVQATPVYPNGYAYLQLSMCAGATVEQVSISLDAQGARASDLLIHPACPTPFTIDVVASGATADGHPLSGSTSVPVNS